MRRGMPRVSEWMSFRADSLKSGVMKPAPFIWGISVFNEIPLVANVVCRIVGSESRKMVLQAHTLRQSFMFVEL